MNVSAPLIEIDHLVVEIQSMPALRGFSMRVAQGTMVSLVGRNGAGKTTTLRTIMGYHRPRGGSIRFNDVPLHERRTFEIARLGLGFAPEESGIFPDLTVAENIEISTWTRPGGRPAAQRLEAAYEIFPVLKKYVARKGPEMSGGERKMLSIARALALDPEMLLLDEPFEGLSPAIVPTVAAGLATRLYVIERGEIIFAGRPDDVRKDAAALRMIGGTV